MVRRRYLDWVRGIAVLIMIEAHVVDSWTAAPWRETQPFGWAILLGGYGAPLFLFLAGVSVALSASAKARKTGDIAGASRAVARRGIQIFFLAFLFRIQAWVLSWGPVRSLLKVDILNIMGPSITAAAGLWGAARTTRGRYVLFTLATLAVALLTPPVRGFAPLAALPDPIEAYIRPIRGLTNFVFFPWMAFVFAGAIVGIAIDGTTTRESESRVNALIALAGLMMVAGGYGGSFLPSIYAHSDFWTTSPAYFMFRTGLLTLAIPIAYVWYLRPQPRRWSPIEQLGRTSFFIYWIHVEMVYGLISLPFHGAFSLHMVFVLLVLFTIAMVAVSVVKDRLAARFKGIRPRTPPPMTPPAPRLTPSD